MNKEELLQKQNEIDERIKQIWGENCSLDGITDIDSYLDSYLNNELPTLWILKEMNRDFQKSGIVNQRELNRDIAGGSIRTWGNIMKVSAGIREYAASGGNIQLHEKDLPKIMDESESKAYYSDVSQGAIFPLDQIAMINVHKGIGTSKSDNSFISAQYSKPEIRKLILDQVEYIDPKVIIVCNYVEQLLCDLAEIDDISKYQKLDDSYNLYYRSSKRLIISTGHPLIRGQKGLTSEKYCNDILDIVYDSGI